VEEAKSEELVWKTVNRERKKWKRINEEIKMEEWEEYFKKVLGGVDKKVIWRKKKGGRSEEERELERWDIRKVVGKMKGGKTRVERQGWVRCNEAWKYGGEEVERWIWGLCNRV